MVSLDDEQTVGQTLVVRSLRRPKNLCNVFVCRAPSLISGASIKNTNDERAVRQSAPARSLGRQTEDGERRTTKKVTCESQVAYNLQNSKKESNDVSCWYFCMSEDLLGW